MQPRDPYASLPGSDDQENIAPQQPGEVDSFTHVNPIQSDTTSYNPLAGQPQQASVQPPTELQQQPQQPGMGMYQEMPQQLSSPVANSSDAQQQFNSATGPGPGQVSNQVVVKAKKEIKTWVHDVLMSLAVAATLAILSFTGWYLWGFIGVRYSEAEAPWQAMESAYRKVDAHFFTSSTHMSRPGLITKSEAEISTTHGTMVEDLDTFKKTIEVLYDTKAMTRGNLADDAAEFRNKSKEYAAYMENRIHSYEIVMVAVSTCPSSETVANIDAMQACEKSLTAINRDSVKDKEFLAFLDEYTNYMTGAVKAMGERSALPAGSSERWSRLQEQSTQSDALTSKIRTIQKDQDAAYKAKQPQDLFLGLKKDLQKKFESESK